MLMPFADLRSQFLECADKLLYDALVEDLCLKHVIFRKNSHIGLVGYAIPLRPEEQALSQKIKKMYQEYYFAPPIEEEVRITLNIEKKVFQNIMRSLIEEGHLIRLSEKVVYHNEALQKAKETIIDYAKKHQGVSVAQLRDTLQVSRKHALAILEYLDKAGMTQRKNDKHILVT